MIHGLDTGFLIAVELAEHVQHAAASQRTAHLRAVSDQIAIAPQVIAEFIHVATDRRRFAQPLDVNTSVQVAEQWWTASDVVQVFPNTGTMHQFWVWLKQLSLGRKRLLDTLLAATYYQAGVQSLLTTNPADFTVFGVFTCITP